MTTTLNIKIYRYNKKEENMKKTNKLLQNSWNMCVKRFIRNYVSEPRSNSMFEMTAKRLYDTDCFSHQYHFIQKRIILKAITISQSNFISSSNMLFVRYHTFDDSI